MSEDDLVLYEVRKRTARLTLNRPPVNAFNVGLFKALLKRLEQADNDPKVKCLVINSSSPKTFSAGIDIRVKPEDPKTYNIELVKTAIAVTEKMVLGKKPIVCVVNGPAIGWGMMVVMASDLRIFVDKPDLFFRMPEVALSMFPGTGATVLSLLAFGLSYAKSILLTSDNFGLNDLPPRFATRIFKPEELEQGVEDFLSQILKHKESIMYLVKSSLTIMNNKLISRWLTLEKECSLASIGGIGPSVEGEEPGLTQPKPVNELDDFIKELFQRYP